MGPWEATAGGATIGSDGPEGGFIQWDQSTPEGVRILLEVDPARSFYSVSCMIPDWMVYPRHFDSLQAAEEAYRQMEQPLLELAAAIPARRPPPGTPDALEAGRKLFGFTVRFP